MQTTRELETALLTEHLQYTPLSLLDNIINDTNELIDRAIDAAENGLLNANPTALGFSSEIGASKNAPGSPDPAMEISEGVHMLQTLLEANVDRNFDKLEIYLLRNVLNIPSELLPWIKLKHYEDLVLPLKPASDSSMSVTPESINTLRTQLRETRKLNIALQTTFSKNAAFLAQLKNMLSPEESEGPKPADSNNTRGAYSFLTHGNTTNLLGGIAKDKGGSQGVLETNASFAISQLPALRSLLHELRPKLVALSKHSNEPAPENATAAERRVFVERQSKRALDRQGVTIGAKEGGIESLGRTVSSREVEAMEAMMDELANRDEQDQD